MVFHGEAHPFLWSKINFAKTHFHFLPFTIINAFPRKVYCVSEQCSSASTFAQRVVNEGAAKTGGAGILRVNVGRRVLKDGSPELGLTNVRCPESWCMAGEEGRWVAAQPVSCCCCLWVHIRSDQAAHKAPAPFQGHHSLPTTLPALCFPTVFQCFPPKLALITGWNKIINFIFALSK